MYQGWTKWAHWALIIFLGHECLYAGYMVFFVLRPEGSVGPLLSQALTIPFELMVTRRLYALEAWVTGGMLVLYLGITEIYPRRKR